MTVIPTQGAFVDEDAAVKLARYAKLIGYPETLFFGIRDDRVTQANKSGWFESSGSTSIVAKTINSVK